MPADRRPAPSRSTSARLATALAAIGVAAAAHAQPIEMFFVDDDAPSGGDGRSWANAFDDLQDALDAASVLRNSVEIRIAGGRYVPGDRGFELRIVDSGLCRVVDEFSDSGSGFVLSLPPRWAATAAQPTAEPLHDAHGEFVSVQPIGAHAGGGLRPPPETPPLVSIPMVIIRGGYAGFDSLDPDEHDPARFRTLLDADLNGDDGVGFINRSDNVGRLLKIFDDCLLPIQLDGLSIDETSFPIVISDLDARGSDLNVPNLVNATSAAIRFASLRSRTQKGFGVDLRLHNVRVSDFNSAWGVFTSGSGLSGDTPWLIADRLTVENFTIGRGIRASRAVLENTIVADGVSSLAPSGISGGIVRIHDSAVINTLAAGASGFTEGGAVAADLVIATDSLFEDNVGALGAAVFAEEARIARCLFATNQSMPALTPGATVGGTVAAQQLGIADSLLVDNRSDAHASSIVALPGAQVSLINNTVVGSDPGSTPLVLLDQPSEIDVFGNIVWDASRTDEPAVHIRAFTPPPTRSGFNVISGGASVDDGTGADSFLALGVSRADPRFVAPDPSNWRDRDYRPGPGSPAIDQYTGNQRRPTAVEELSLLFNARTLFGGYRVIDATEYADREFESFLDSGAFEADASTPRDTSCRADFVPDGRLDILDVVAFLDAFSRRSSRANFDGNPQFTIFDIVEFLRQWSAGCP